MPDLDGPYLQMALLCEKVIEDKEGVLSLIRVVDRILVQLQQIGGTPGSQPPSEMPAVPVRLSLVLSFKSGPARGTRRLRVTMRAPSGMKIGSDITVPMFFEGDERGHNVVLNAALEATEEGLYWFDAALDDVPVTRIPLRIIYQPASLTRPASL